MAKSTVDRLIVEDRQLAVHARQALSDNVSPAALLVDIADIDERTRAETLLAEISAQYRHTIEASPLVYWSGSQAGVLDRMSPRFKEWTGVDGLDNTWMQRIHPDDLPKMIKAVHDGVASKNGLDDTHRLRFSNDEYRWVRTQATGWFDDSGDIIRWYGTIQDINDTVLYDQRMTESELRFKLIADSAPVPMWVVDLDGRQEFVNQAYMAFLGHATQEEALELDWFDKIHPEDIGLVSEIIGERITAQNFVFEARFLRSDGEYRHVRVQQQPRYDGNHEIVGCHGVAYDITDSKTTEIAMRQLNETLESQVRSRTMDLEETNSRLLGEINERQLAQEAFRQSQKMESIGQLTGGIAHDFNNMLTIIIGNLELIKLMSKALSEKPATVAKLYRGADMALEAADTAAKLTAQLLAFSRKARLQTEKVNANQIIENVSEMVDRSIGRSVTIKTELQEDLWLCLSDKAQLELAIVNLALNSRDAMPEGGEIVIRTGNREIISETGKSEKFISVTVIDTGYGMTEDTIHKVFEPFYTTKEVGKGTGLGLSMVYGFCQQSNGRVEIRSQVGAGTEVEMLFPFTHGMLEEPKVVTSPATLSSTKAVILVVEDEPGVRELAVSILEDLGYGVIQSPDGVHAVEIIKESKVEIDLIFSDIVMPGGVDGFGVADAAEKHRPSIPIILTTGHAEVILQDVSKDRLNKLTILGKPYRIDDLVNAITNILERSIT